MFRLLCGKVALNFSGSEVFLNLSIKEKIDKFGYINIKDFCSTNTIKNERRLQTGERFVTRRDHFTLTR